MPSSLCEHAFRSQQVACTILGFRWMSKHQRRALVRKLHNEVSRCADREQLLPLLAEIDHASRPKTRVTE